MSVEWTSTVELHGLMICQGCSYYKLCSHAVSPRHRPRVARKPLNSQVEPNACSYLSCASTHAQRFNQAVCGSGSYTDIVRCDSFLP